MFISAKASFPRPEPEAQPYPALIDNPFSPELFATGVAGFCNMGGAVQLTLDSLRCDHARANPVLERVVVGRVTLPIPVAQALVTALNAFLEQQGFSPTKAMAAGASFQ
ncbi:hypothetical protein [Sphingomonas prati]|nr:hypothetical protein [Sphingomonas prati]GGE91236.1 hypothetical protein GCM10011404_25240 [Sphingomonas prati]